MNNILQFVNNHPRNRLIIVKHTSLELSYLDIGKKLSKRLQHQTEGRIANYATKFLDEIVEQNLLCSEDLGSYIAIENIGILMEKELKINLRTILEKYSRDTTLIIKWEGVIDGNKLYFLSKENGKEINLNGISNLII